MPTDNTGVGVGIKFQSMLAQWPQTGELDINTPQVYRQGRKVVVWYSHFLNAGGCASFGLGVLKYGNTSSHPIEGFILRIIFGFGLATFFGGSVLLIEFGFTKGDMNNHSFHFIGSLLLLFVSVITLLVIVFMNQLVIFGRSVVAMQNFWAIIIVLITITLAFVILVIPGHIVTKIATCTMLFLGELGKWFLCGRVVLMSTWC